MSCKITGKYTYYGYNTNCELELKADATFIEKIRIDLESDSLWGRWQRYGDTLILDIVYPVVYFGESSGVKVEELINSERDSIYFEVLYQDTHEAVPFLNVFLNEDTYNVAVLIDSNGKASVKKKSIDNFIITSLRGHFLSHYITNKAANFFKIYVNFGEIPDKITRIFPTTKYVIKQNKLIPLDFKNRTRNDYYYLRAKGGGNVSK